MYYAEKEAKGEISCNGDTDGFLEILKTPLRDRLIESKLSSYNSIGFLVALYSH